VTAPELQRRLHFLARRLAAAQRRWRLFADGDRLLVAFSGGKDSLALLHVLAWWLPRSGLSCELAACHVEIAGAVGNAERRDALAAMAREAGVPLSFAAIDPVAATGGSRDLHPCFRCSRLRRRALLEVARDGGFDTIVLGHHLDDAAETVLMNLTARGDPTGLVPRRDYADGRIAVVRPLLLAAESELARVAALLPSPSLPPYACPLEADRADTSREKARAYLRSLGRRSRAARRHLLRLSLQAAGLTDGGRRPYPWTAEGTDDGTAR